MTDWQRGYTAGWEVYEVNRDTWADGDRIDGILSVDVNKSCTDTSPKLEEGSMDVMADSFGARWCRIYMTAEQAGIERHPIATLLFESASSRFDHQARTIKAEGRSVLQPAADVKMTRGSFAAKGTDGAAFAGRLIASCTPAPVTVEGSFMLGDDVVFDIGSTNLDAAWMLLDAGGWCMQIDGRGEIHIRKKPDQPALELSGANVGLLIPGVDDEFDISEVPNRYIAIDDDNVEIATNEDPESATSYQSRGRWVDELDESPVLIDGEALAVYAQRKLSEKSTVTRTYRYQREYLPDLNLYDLVRATVPENGIEGVLRVRSQDLQCEHGVVVTEAVEEEVSL